MIESGLILPIRFYSNLTEQDRYKRHSVGSSIPEVCYPYVDCVHLAPFQIKGNLTSDDLIHVDWWLVCADTNEETELPFDNTYWNDNVLTYDEHRIMYFGTQDLSAFTSNGLKYLKATITYTSGSKIYYSDLFMIGNCGEGALPIESFRTWQSPDNLRSINVTDLRII